jgi:hypothetical protein
MNFNKIHFLILKKSKENKRKSKKGFLKRKFFNECLYKTDQLAIYVVKDLKKNILGFFLELILKIFGEFL